jgi:DNA-binding response OmpR family regulator
VTQDASSSSSGSLPIDTGAEVPRLLIVEDNDDLRRALAAYFTEAGWHVKATRALGSALAIANQHLPHVIITELALPDARGYRFVDTYRRAVPSHNVKVIAVTRMPEMLFARAREIGFDDVLAKPVDFDQLLTRIKAI